MLPVHCAKSPLSRTLLGRAEYRTAMNVKRIYFEYTRYRGLFDAHPYNDCLECIRKEALTRGSQSSQQAPMAWWAACAMRSAVRTPVVGSRILRHIGHIAAYGSGLSHDSPVSLSLGVAPCCLGLPLLGLARGLSGQGTPSRFASWRGDGPSVPGFPSIAGVLWPLACTLVP